MMLVDTSVWIEHLRTGDESLIALLNSSHVLAHPFVIGELACGNLRKRTDVLRLLNDLPQAPVASQEEALLFIERNALIRDGVQVTFRNEGGEPVRWISPLLYVAPQKRFFKREGGEHFGPGLRD